MVSSCSYPCTARINPPTTTFHRYIWESELTDYDTQHALEKANNDTDPEAKHRDAAKSPKKSKAKSGGRVAKKPTADFEDSG